ncbi:MAG: transporter associated domain-containing protein [Candidatus Bipolaricaulia bacterium]
MREFLVDGEAEIDLLNEKLGLALPLDEGVTISGLLLTRFEAIPREGRANLSRSAE